MQENGSGITWKRIETARRRIVLASRKVSPRKIEAPSRRMESKRIEVVPRIIVPASRRLYRENCSDIQENWSIKSLVGTSRAVRRNVEISSSTTAIVSKKEVASMRIEMVSRRIVLASRRIELA